MRCAVRSASTACWKWPSAIPTWPRRADYGPRKQLRRALEAARALDAGKIAKENPADVAGAIRRARLVAIAALQPSTGF